MGKVRKTNALLSLLTTLASVCALAVSVFPFLHLAEGSFLFATLGALHSLADGYLNVFPDGGLRVFGLFPFAGLCLLNMILAFCGSGMLATLFRCILFYGLYLIGAFVQGGGEDFAILSVLPSWYHFIGLGAFLVSIAALAVISRHGRKKEKEDKVPEGSDADASLPEEPKEPLQSTSGVLEEARQDVECNAEPPKAFSLFNRLDSGSAEVPAASTEEAPEVAREPYVYDSAASRKALKSLTDVQVPEYEVFPNHFSSDMLSSAVKGNFGVAEREARIRKEEQERRAAELERQRLEAEERARQRALEEERAREEAEAERKRLEQMFKPRNLMRRLSEEAKAEKSFPSFGSSMSAVDYGISGSRTTQLEQVRQDEPEAVREPEKPQAVQFQSPSVQSCESVRFVQPEAAASKVESDIPVSQRMGNAFSSTPDMNQGTSFSVETAVQYPEEEEFEAPASAVFKEAAIQAELDDRIAANRRAAEIERKHQEELEALGRQRQEAQEAARRMEAELAAARAELQRQKEEAEAQLLQQQKQLEEARKAIQAEAPKAPATEAASEPSFRQAEPDDDEEIPASEVPAAKEKKGPDVDYVSGVAGTRNASSGNSYLIDKQKFEYRFPPESYLKHYETNSELYDNPENDPNGQIIVNTLREFRIETVLTDVQHGPTFTLYELSLTKAIKVSNIVGYADNIAMELAAESVRILAPIPGKPAIGVEVPNKKRDVIGFDVMMPALKSKYYKIPMVLGRNITGDSIVIDLAKTPHLLIAGTTGSGKSVCVNGLICSVLYTKTPKEVRMILVDPKMVELSLYNGIPHLLTPVITEPKKALKAMNFVVEEMERRMALFSSIGAKKIEEYNEKIEELHLLRVKLPYIMVIIDEFADLMLAVGNELVTSIKRITAVARFCGIHLVLATQRPSVDVITGVIKSNIPTQIAFAVSNTTNSKIIIDSPGAEKLLGRGDMLYNDPAARTPSRIQGAYIDSEIESIVEFVKTQGEPDYIDESYFEDDDDDEEEAADDGGASGDGEDMFSKAWKIVTDKGEASASYLQRKLGIGYNRAANLIEQLEDAGYIGPARGSKAREVLRFYGSD